jgi:hypothetical protein
MSLAVAWRFDLAIVYCLGCLSCDSHSRLEITVLIHQHTCAQFFLRSIDIENHVPTICPPVSFADPMM